MNALYKYFITRLVAWFSGLSAADFQRILAWVSSQEVSGIPGAQKAAVVVRRILETWSRLDNSTAAWLVETALRWVRKLK